MLEPETYRAGRGDSVPRLIHFQDYLVEVVRDRALLRCIVFWSDILNSLILPYFKMRFADWKAGMNVCLSTRRGAGVDKCAELGGLSTRMQDSVERTEVLLGGLFRSTGWF